MLAGAGIIFDNLGQMLRHLKKKNYESNTEIFRQKNGHYFTEMTEYVEESASKEQAAQEIGECLVRTVKERFAGKKGKIDARTQADLNFFMIYYVFPAILDTGHEDAEVIADGICKVWGKSFKESNIRYTDYETLYNSFREKIFGIF